MSELNGATMIDRRLLPLCLTLPLLVCASAAASQPRGAAAAPADIGQDAPIVARSRLRAPGLQIGSCRGSSGQLDLARLRILDRQSIAIQNSATLSIRDESVVISDARPGHQNQITVHDISRLMHEGEDLDITLNIALYDEQPVLYWKETFLNRSYRQGLISIGERLRLMCEGRGGVDRSH